MNQVKSSQKSSASSKVFFLQDTLIKNFPQTYFLPSSTNLKSQLSVTA